MISNHQKQLYNFQISKQPPFSCSIFYAYNIKRKTFIYHDFFFWYEFWRLKVRQLKYNVRKTNISKTTKGLIIHRSITLLLRHVKSDTSA